MPRLLAAQLGSAAAAAAQAGSALPSAQPGLSGAAELPAGEATESAGAAEQARGPSSPAGNPLGLGGQAGGERSLGQAAGAVGLGFGEPGPALLGESNGERARAALSAGLERLRAITAAARLRRNPVIVTLGGPSVSSAADPQQGALPPAIAQPAGQGLSAQDDAVRPGKAAEGDRPGANAGNDGGDMDAAAAADQRPSRLQALVSSLASAGWELAGGAGRWFPRYAGALLPRATALLPAYPSYLPAYPAYVHFGRHHQLADARAGAGAGPTPSFGGPAASGGAEIAGGGGVDKGQNLESPAMQAAPERRLLLLASHRMPTYRARALAACRAAAGPAQGPGPAPRVAAAARLDPERVLSTAVAPPLLVTTASAAIPPLPPQAGQLGAAAGSTAQGASAGLVGLHPPGDASQGAGRLQGLRQWLPSWKLGLASAPGADAHAASSGPHAVAGPDASAPAEQASGKSFPGGQPGPRGAWLWRPWRAGAAGAAGTLGTAPQHLWAEGHPGSSPPPPATAPGRWQWLARGGGGDDAPVTVRVRVTGEGLAGITGVRACALGANWLQARIAARPPLPRLGDADDGAQNAAIGWSGAADAALGAQRRMVQALRRRVGLDSGSAATSPAVGAADAGTPHALLVEVVLPVGMARALGEWPGTAPAPPGGGASDPAPPLELHLRSDFRTCHARVDLRAPAAWLLPLRDAAASRAALAAVAEAGLGSRFTGGGALLAGAAGSRAGAVGKCAGFPTALVDGVRWVDLAGGPGAAPPAIMAALVALRLAGAAPEAGRAAGEPHTGGGPLARMRGLLAPVLAAPTPARAWRALAAGAGERGREAGGSLNRRLLAARHRAAWQALAALPLPAALVVLWDVPGAALLSQRHLPDDAPHTQSDTPAAASQGRNGAGQPPWVHREAAHAAAAARRAGVRVVEINVGAGAQGRPRAAPSPSPDLEPVLVWRGDCADAAQRLRMHVYQALTERARL